MLNADRVTKIYRGGVKANDEISLEVNAGEVFGLLGPNGAGKTTLVAQILGLRTPTSGAITIDGTDVVARPEFARSVCSYQPQSSVPIEGLSPMDAISLVGRIRGGTKSAVRTRAQELIATLDLGEFAKRSTTLSGGVLRLVAFCMAAVVPGRVVVLDEPTNDVDPLRRKALWTSVRKLADDGAAVVLVTHNVIEAEKCVDRLAIIDGGRVVASGTPAELRSAIGLPLRLEIALEAGRSAPEAPTFMREPVVNGRRMVGELDADEVDIAVRWAMGLRTSGLAEEFSIGPATLEDVYVKRVRTPELAS